MKLELGILVGAESKEWLADLTKQLDRLEALQTKGKETAATTTDDVEETTVISAKTIAAAKSKKTAAKTTGDEDETFDLGEESADAEDTPAVTKKDLITACRENREAAIKVMKKMKVASIHDLKPAQYATVLQQIGAN